MRQPVAKQDKKSNEQVSMSNTLVRAAQRLLLSEKRLVALGIAGSDQKMSLPPNCGWIVRIHATQYAAAFDVDIHTAYDQLKSAARRLYLREVSSIWQIKQLYDDEVEFHFRWVTSAKYFKSEGWVELNFSPEVVPYLFDLKNKFTTFKLSQTTSLQSIYAWRLYEVLLSYESQQKEKEFGIDEFAHLMDAPGSCFKDFGAMRRVVLEIAINEINAKSDLKILEVGKDKKGNPVFFESIKKGKKVAWIKFHFKMDEQLKMHLPKPPTKPKSYTKDDLDRNSTLARPGETYEQALKRLNTSK
jgi:plasmid replication initiation protein